MKKIIMLMGCLLCLVACEKENLTYENIDEGEDVDVSKLPSKKFTFTVKGEFESATFMSNATTFRAPVYLSGDGNAMTDLWVFDYMNDRCVQSIHQVSTDESWGKPQMSLAYGTHHVYFVASRGDSPTLDDEGHMIVWGIPKDTFWKDYSVEVVSTSNGNRAVTLDRVATKLKISVNDEVPSNLGEIAVTPEKWYYGLDYKTGDAVSAQKKERTVTVPESYYGTTGRLVANFFGISGSDEWTTNIAVEARGTDASVLGKASITGAPFKRNRATEYSGNLFASGGGFDVSISDDWDNPVTGEC